jgi:glutathione S-transferase
MDARPTLWHIEISHYSEKVRWALDYKGVAHERRAPMPGYHIGVALALTRGRQYTFPVLELDGRRIGDSTAIIAALEERYPEPPLYPSHPAQRERALAIEDWFDEQLGPYIRRFVFHALRDQRNEMERLSAMAAPPALSRFKRMSVLYARGLTAARFLAGSERAAERARIKVLAAVDHLEQELGSNEYLVGDRFTVADLTAAALLYPLVLPPEGPAQYEIPDSYRRLREPLMERRGYRWVEEMFRRHRGLAAPAVAAGSAQEHVVALD